MRTHRILAFAVLFSSGVAGCGSTSPEDTYQAIISVKKEATAALKGIKDEASAESALGKLEEIAGQYADLKRRMKGFSLSADESEKLIDKYWKQEGEAGDELTRAAAAARQQAPRHAERITAILGKLGIHQTTIEDAPSKGAAPDN